MVEDLTFPTSLAFVDDGALYAAEAGLPLAGAEPATIGPVPTERPPRKPSHPAWLAQALARQPAAKAGARARRARARQEWT